ncbi:MULTISPECIES: redox-sensing transcriptional repressor Rex [unclassified Rhodococcus (in: high G+C Gram-positive bacteria)]|uniref:redox-sensing transcriptional repressor Rex n=1 Tax=unclassified Rhodococcus (in: high G+C Gram-positive bacteria) TaxID=192944 RepID=UPI003FA76381
MDVTSQRRLPGVGGARSGAAADSGRDGDVASRVVPQATVTRFAGYLRVLGSLSDSRVMIVSSEDLATAAGVGSATLRKDLSFLGPMGVRGVGYDVARLRARIELALGLDRGHRVVLVGMGHLGTALVGYHGFSRRGFTMVALFDNDPAVVGREVTVGNDEDGFSQLVVRHVDTLVDVATTLGATVGVVATPDAAAQEAVDALVQADIDCILSFASTDPVTPAHVDLRRVDLAVELQVLSFANAHKAPRNRPNRQVCRDTRQSGAKNFAGPGNRAAAASRNGSVTAP